jgi:hypothetical protein
LKTIATKISEKRILKFSFKLPYFLYMVQVASKKYELFFFSYCVNSQIWLNYLSDDHHLGYITKLKGIFLNT